jgi:FdhD protein
MATLPPPPQPMPSERATALYLNGNELLTIQTTPVFLEDWAQGFLYTEGIIQQPENLRQVLVRHDPVQVHAQVDRDCLQDRELAGKRYLTSGCGKGITFSSVKDAMQLRPIRHTLSIRPEQIAAWMVQMQKRMPLYVESGGMHAAAAVRIADGEILVREDIGRHNAVDKAIGASLSAGWAPEGLVMLTTGRISYEMCAKLGRFGIGLGASITAATDQATRLANRLNIDLLGYARSVKKHLLYTEGRHLFQEAK